MRQTPSGVPEQPPGCRVDVSECLRFVPESRWLLPVFRGVAGSHDFSIATGGR
jgi:hypothetical protein